jgi:hypothetical protein
MENASKFSEEARKTIITFIRSGTTRQQACAQAGITRKTLNNWEKRAAAGEAEYSEFVDELQLAQDQAEAKLGVISYAMATGGVVRGADGKIINFEGINPRTLEFLMMNGGSRAWGEIKKLELTGKDGTRLYGDDVTPAAAAAIVRAKFGDQARRTLEDDEEAAPAPPGDVGP